jgi:dsDNA-specific endonuclease/ATPase MutS2
MSRTEEEPDPVELPITGTLDLHMFRPSDVGDLVPTYLAECRKRGILQVRIIHGKGTGALRETVHAILRRLPEVTSFGLAPEYAGGWGATCLQLTADHAGTPGEASECRAVRGPP